MTSVENSGRNEGEGVLTTHNSGDKAVIFEKTQTVNFVAYTTNGGASLGGLLIGEYFLEGH